MTVGAEKVTGVTPAEFADQVQGLVRGAQISEHQGTIATGILGAIVVERPGRIRGMQGKILTTGTATQTDLDVKVIRAGATANASVFAAVLSVLNTDADGTEFNHKNFAADPASLVEPGDVVYLEVTAAPTAGANLHAQVAIDDRFDPQPERPLLS